jgi:purine-nucleoside phosphorylase
VPKGLSSKQYTAKDLAKKFDCAVRTVNYHATRLFGPGEKLKARYFDEYQVTAILESIKKTNADEMNRTKNARVPSIETEMTDEYRLAMLYKQQANLLKEANDIERKLRLKTETKLRETERRLGEEVVSHSRTKSGLEMYQRIAEVAGYTLTDREDVLSTYRR